MRKTTLRLPDRVLHRAKVAAAHRSQTLRDFMLSALLAHLGEAEAAIVADLNGARMAISVNESTKQV